MVETNDEDAVRYVNSEAGFCSLGIVNSDDCLIYISNTEVEKGH